MINSFIPLNSGVYKSIDTYKQALVKDIGLHNVIHPTPDAHMSRNKCKVVIIGDMNVGKTSLLMRYIRDSYDNFVDPTIGIDFLVFFLAFEFTKSNVKTKTIMYEGEVYRFQLWDTAGQERFHSLIPSYMRDAQVVLVSYFSERISLGICF